MAHLKKKQQTQKNNKLQWHTKTAVGKIIRPTEHFKHVCVSTQADGQLDLSTSYLTTISSKPGDMSSPITEMQFGDSMSDKEVPCKPEFLDPEYIQHLAEMSLDPCLSSKWHQTPGVSSKNLISFADD